MIVTLDDQRLRTTFAPDCTLQMLVEQVRAQHDNRLIVSIAVNGQRLADDDLDASLPQPLALDSQIDLESGDTRQVVGDALRELAQQFEDAGQRHGEIAERLVAGDAAGAVQDIGRYIGLWQTCQRVLVQCSGLLGRNLTRCEHDHRPVHVWLNEVVKRLAEIRDALEARDMVLLADLVRYELPGLCQTWQALLNDLAKQVR